MYPGADRLHFGLIIPPPCPTTPASAQCAAGNPLGPKKSPSFAVGRYFIRPAKCKACVQHDSRTAASATSSPSAVPRSTPTPTPRHAGGRASESASALAAAPASSASTAASARATPRPHRWPRRRPPTSTWAHGICREMETMCPLPTRKSLISFALFHAWTRFPSLSSFSCRPRHQNTDVAA